MRIVKKKAKQCMCTIWTAQKEFYQSLLGIFACQFKDKDFERTKWNLEHVINSDLKFIVRMP